MKRFGLPLAGATLLASCASVSPEKGFSDVRALVADRGIAQLHWNQGTPADAEALQAVRELLKSELTADAAVQIALLDNRRLQATLEDIGIAQADLVQAGLLSNPIFHGEIRFPAHPTSPLELDVLENFFDLLLLPMRKRVAASQFEAVKLRVADAVLELASKTRSDFYSMQGAQQQVEMRRTIVLSEEAAVDAAERLHAAGNLTDLELANEQALLARARIELAAAEGQLLEAREVLTTAMGLWAEDIAITIAPQLPDLPEVEIDAAGLETLAVARRLDLAAARADVEASARAAGFASYQAIAPRFDMGFHSEREPDGLTTIGPSLDIPIPIFDQGRPAKARALAMLRQSEQRYAALAIEARSQVRRARNHMLAARKRAEYEHAVVLPLRQQILQETLLRYNGMLVGVFQLLQAKEAEIEAGQEYIESLLEYWMARTELERAVGGRLPDANAAADAKPETGAQAPTTKPTEPEMHHDHQHGSQQ